MRPLLIRLAPVAFAAVLTAPPTIGSPLAAEEGADRVKRLEAALRAAPGHGGLLFQLARERALQDDAAGALLYLDQAIATGLDLDIESEPAFIPLRHRRELMALLDRALDQRVVARNSVEAFRVKERDLIPEGLAQDSTTGDFFLGSLLKKKIVRVGADGRAHDFTSAGQDGLCQVLGLKVDSKRRLLWAMTAAGKAEGAREGWSAAYVYELGSGQLARRYPMTEGKHLFNDLALARDGGAFITDSEAGAVWRIEPGRDAPVPLVGAGGLDYPNGIALSGDERRLYVADFAHGISIVDPATGRVRPLPHPPGVSPHGIDGLYWHESGLIGVQNGAGTERIVRYRLSGDGERVLGLDVLESRNPLFAIPTTGAIAGSAFYYIANSRLDQLSPEGRLRPGARLEDVVVLRAPLGPPANATTNGGGR